MIATWGGDGYGSSPPGQSPTVYHYFRTWTHDGTLTRLHAGLREQVRIAEGHNATPSAAIMDSQSERAAETVAKTSRGYDAGKKINDRKSHIAVDTTGLLLIVLVTTGAVQDRDAARALLYTLRTCFTRVVKVWANAGYAGQLVHWATDALGLTVEIVPKLADQVGFRSCTAGGWWSAALLDHPLPPHVRDYKHHRTPRRDRPVGHGHLRDDRADVEAALRRH